MRITAADHAASALRLRQGDIMALIVEQGGKYKMPLLPDYRSATVKDVIQILRLTRLQPKFYPDRDNPLHPTAWIWVFPDNIDRYL